MIFRESSNCPPNLENAREGLKLLLNELDKSMKEERAPLILFEAPTGYGKSTATPLLLEYQDLHFRRIIHVLPLRAIIDKLLHTFSHCLARKRLGYQMMGRASAPVDKSPFFAPDYVLSTIDSFIINLYRGNVAEAKLGHFETPRAFIMSSLTVFDEIHLPFRSGDAVLSQVVLDLTYVSDILKIPMIFMTATFSDQLIRKIKKRKNIKIISVTEKIDPEFFEKFKRIKWRYEGIKDPVGKALELAESGIRVLRITKTVNRAIDEYRRLRDGAGKVVLIHGRMTPGDRERQLRKIEEANIAVGTSAIEAGLDVSFQALITDETGPESMVQRCGRICRYSEYDEASVFIHVESEKGRQHLDFLSKKDINMRVKYGKNGYGAYLSAFYEEKPTIMDTSRHRSLLLSLPFHDVIRDLYAYGCEVVRENVLVPVLPYGSDPRETFAMNLKFLARHPNILNWDGNRLMVVNEEGEDEFREFNKERLSNCMSFSRFLVENRVWAVVLKEGVYQDGIGVYLMD